MSSFPYRNEEYRDELGKFTYPFDEVSLLSQPDLYIGTDLILDAILFFKQPVALPIRISSIDGTSGTIAEFRINLTDDDGDLVGYAIVDASNEVSKVYNEDSVQIGTLLFDLDTLIRFNASVAGKVILLNGDTAIFSLDVTHVANVKHARYVAADNMAASGDVRLVARHGCRFVVESGVVSLDILGDISSLSDQLPITSINGVAKPSIWLTNHPEANVRIHTKNRGLKFQAVTDSD